MNLSSFSPSFNLCLKWIFVCVWITTLDWFKWLLFHALLCATLICSKPKANKHLFDWKYSTHFAERHLLYSMNAWTLIFPKICNAILNRKMFDISLEAKNWLQPKWNTSLVLCQAFAMAREMATSILTFWPSLATKLTHLVRGSGALAIAIFMLASVRHMMPNHPETRLANIIIKHKLHLRWKPLSGC